MSPSMKQSDRCSRSRQGSTKCTTRTANRNHHSAFSCSRCRACWRACQAVRALGPRKGGGRAGTRHAPTRHTRRVCSAQALARLSRACLRAKEQHALEAPQRVRQRPRVERHRVARHRPRPVREAIGCGRHPWARTHVRTGPVLASGRRISIRMRGPPYHAPLAVRPPPAATAAAGCGIASWLLSPGRP